MKKAVNYAVNILAWIIIVLAVLVTVVVFASRNDVGVPNIFGNMIFNIQTDSMNPTIKPGDAIIVKQVPESEAKSLKVGDIVTFWTKIQDQTVINTHRIEKVVTVEDGASYFHYVTKGDKPGSVSDTDLLVPDEVIGIYSGTRIAKLGSCLDFLKTSAGFFVCIILPLLLFFLYELYVFIKTVLSANREKAVASVAEKEDEIKKKAIEEYLAKQAGQQTPPESTDTPADTPDSQDKT